MQRKLLFMLYFKKTNLIINIAANLFTSRVRNIQIIIRFCMQIYILIRKVLISKAIDVKDVVYKNIKMQKGVSKLRKNKNTVNTDINTCMYTKI